MTTPTKRKGPGRPKGTPRPGAAFVRLNPDEKAAILAAAPFEPLASALRRLALERAAMLAAPAKAYTPKVPRPSRQRKGKA